MSAVVSRPAALSAGINSANAAPVSPTSLDVFEADKGVCALLEAFSGTVAHHTPEPPEDTTPAPPQASAAIVRLDPVREGLPRVGDRWDLDHFRACTLQMPRPLARALAASYEEVFNTQGRRAANELALSTRERLDSQVPPAARALGLDADDNRIRAAAKEAVKMMRSRLESGHVASALASACRMLGTDRIGPDEATEDGQIKRVLDETFWRRELRKTLRAWRESAHVLIAPERIKYCSAFGIQEYRTMLQNQEKWAAEHELKNEGGDVLPLPSPAQTAQRQAARTFAITRGMADIAIAAGMTPTLVTITLESEWHPTTTKGTGKRRRNPNYNGASAREGALKLQDRWTKARAAWARRGLRSGSDFFWTMGVQPHTDETPHWHAVIWSHPANWDTMQACIERAFRKSDFAGQIDYEKIDDPEAAVGYIIRMLQYATRQIDTHEPDPKKRAEAMGESAWASAHRLRRVRSSHSHATLWKLARRKDIDAPPEIKAAAMDGRWADFHKSVTALGAKIVYNTHVGRYGETYKKAEGISLADGTYSLVSVRWHITSKNDPEGTVNLKGQGEPNLPQNLPPNPNPLAPARAGPPSSRGFLQ